MIFTKHRFEIWNQTQHPYKHTLGDFSYVNPATPGVTNVESAFNWIFAVLYPNTKESVATFGDLPLVGNTLNDYRVVQDDGDGKAASYRWEQREGEASPSWHKVYDMDWGQDSILAAFQDQTQDLYVWRNGRTELDSNGDPIVGLFSGQTIFGGNQPNQNLTLRATSGDGVGPHTGFVQIDDQFRPAVTNVYDLGTTTERWRSLFVQTSALIGTLSLSSGVVTDAGGEIDFVDNDLLTTGNITGGTITGTSLIASDGTDSVTLVPGSITDSTGSISFISADLFTSGTLGAGVTTITNAGETLVLNPSVSGQARITSSIGTISLVANDLVTTGDITGSVLTGTRLDVDDVRVDGNTVSIFAANADLILQANGTGVVDIQSDLTTLGIETTGTHTVTGQFNIDDIRIDGHTISSQSLNTDVRISPNGTGALATDARILPSTDAALDLGAAASRFRDLYLSGGITDGTSTMALSTLLGLRSSVWRDLAQTQPAQTGDALFFDAVNNVWLASVPDSEIDHFDISNLDTDDAGHTQFVMLTGRSGGQVIQGGSGDAEDLIIESTASLIRGNVFVGDNFLPYIAANFSGVWNGLDLGSSSFYFRDLYTRGQLRGARFENVTLATLPASSAQNIGRVVYATDVSKAYVDVGTSFKVLGVSKYVQDQVFDGIITVLDVNVSADITDARNAQWQLRDNANEFEIVFVTIRATSASNVRITTNVPLPAGSYRLIGVE